MDCTRNGPPKQIDPAPARHDHDHDRRIAEIRDGAVTRQFCGQAAQHHLTADGQHVVMLRGGEEFVGETLALAINAACEATR